MSLLSRGTLWPIGITTILAGTVALNLWVMRVAGDDPSMVVEPNYYAKAIRWDDEMAQARRNAALGWQTTASLGAVDAASRAEVRLAVRDAQGAPITNARVTVDAFAITRSATVEHAALIADGESYRAALPIHTLGRWELRFTVVRDTDTFTTVQRVDAAAMASLGRPGEPQISQIAQIPTSRFESVQSVKSVAPTKRAVGT